MTSVIECSARGIASKSNPGSGLIGFRVVSLRLLPAGKTRNISETRIRRRYCRLPGWRSPRNAVAMIVRHFWRRHSNRNFACRLPTETVRPSWRPHPKRDGRCLVQDTPLDKPTQPTAGVHAAKHVPHIARRGSNAGSIASAQNPAMSPVRVSRSISDRLGCGTRRRSSRTLADNKSASQVLFGEAGAAKS